MPQKLFDGITPASAVETAEDQPGNSK